ncbi:MAG: hypothetical protein ACKV19_16295 [Verrucomicrobiales bacterium]
MNWARRQTIATFYKAACEMPVVDCHTHVQDDLTNFDRALAEKNLAGTQAAMNAYPDYLIDAAIANGRLVRRTMMDVAHGCFYSWFAEIAEGHRGRLDDIINIASPNTAAARCAAGKYLIAELRDSRFTEYAEWLRVMFRLYQGVEDLDPLDPANFDIVQEAILKQRNDPDFATGILSKHKITAYVTSIENRDRIPMEPRVRPTDVDLSHATHPEAYQMFDANYLVWPEGATDFGLFTAGYKYESEKYLLHLEQILGGTIECVKTLKLLLETFFWSILYSPSQNPTSRVRYTDLYHPMDYRLGTPYDTASVNSAIRYRKNCLRGEDLKQICAVVTEVMLETLNEIGADLKSGGRHYGSCLQIAIGVDYFMDPSREIQSFPRYAAGVAQDEYPVWTNYPDIEFEYIVAHDQLYEDMANAAKQIGNVSVGPWWHFFRTHKIAAKMRDQLSMGPISSIASGFTDARFVEMLVAKYGSIRYAVSMALADLADDPASSMTIDHGLQVMREILYINPIERHNLPLHT